MGTLFFKKEVKMGQRQSLQLMMLEKLDSCMLKNEIRTLPNTIHKDNQHGLKTEM